MTYLSFRVKNLELLKSRISNKDVSISIGIKNLEVYLREGDPLESIGSFGSLHTLTKNIERIIVKSEFLNFLIFFKLDPSFKFIIEIGKNPDWMFAENTQINLCRTRLSIVKDSFYNEDLKEVKRLVENYTNNKFNWDWTEEELENVSKIIENSYQFKKCKKDLNDQKIIFLQEEVDLLKREKEEQYLEIEKLTEEIELARLNHEDFIDKSENWHKQQIAQEREEADHWKIKFQSLEKKFEGLESKYFELIIKESL